MTTHHVQTGVVRKRDNVHHNRGDTNQSLSQPFTESSSNYCFSKDAMLKGPD
jgi:hypothetical protein